MYRIELNRPMRTPQASWSNKFTLAGGPGYMIERDRYMLDCLSAFLVPLFKSRATFGMVSLYLQ